MIFIKKKLSKNLGIFSNGCLLTTFTFDKLNGELKIIFSEKDFKLFESLSKNQQENSKLKASINYLKTLFK